MTRVEHLLTKLAEEPAEVTQRVTFVAKQKGE